VRVKTEDAPIVPFCVGEVDAPDERAAIKRAAEVFDIPPERQNRISVRRLTKGER